jgi:hypothetical protein
MPELKKEASSKTRLSAWVVVIVQNENENENKMLKQICKLDSRQESLMK